MSADQMPRQQIPMPTPERVDRAIRLTYTQMMLNAVFGASTGGMFLVGFAMDLGADNVLLGLMTTIPQFFVAFQLLAAWLVEREVSRRRLTIAFSFVTPLCWFLIAALPFLGESAPKSMRFTVLFGIIAAVTAVSQIAGNARSSWVGELVPEQRRGRFFGYCNMFAGIVGATFAIAEGRFLDTIRSHGLLAFTALFFFGSLFGLASAALNIPQPDCPLPGAGQRPPFGELVKGTFRNRQFCMLAGVHAIVALGAIAGPFGAAYCLRDVGLTFFQLGLLNSVNTAALLLGSPFWGKMVDRFGCRPILILGLVILAPCAAVWIAIPPKAPDLAMRLLPWTNFLSGFGSAAFSVAINTMCYKTSDARGRSVQFALYSIFVSLIAAPMPALGGWLVSALEHAGWHVDLRLTFYLWAVFIIAAAIVATRLREPKSLSTRVLVFNYFASRITEWLSENIPSIFGGVDEEKPEPPSGK